MSSSTKSKIRALGAKIKRAERERINPCRPMVHIVEYGADEYVPLFELKPGDMLIDLTGASDVPSISEGHFAGVKKHSLMLGMRN